MLFGITSASSCGDAVFSPRRVLALLVATRSGAAVENSIVRSFLAEDPLLDSSALDTLLFVSILGDIVVKENASLD